MKSKLIILLLISLVNDSSSSVKFELEANPNQAEYKNLTLFLQEILSRIAPDYEIIYKDIYVTATPWFLDFKLKNCFIIAKEDIKTSSKPNNLKFSTSIGGNRQKTWFICPKN
jgi:hypothetical protein